MRPLRYMINATLDGCVDHRVGSPDEETHAHANELVAQADAMLLGRITYEMMEAGWRAPVPPGARPEWMEPFAATMNAAKKYVVSRTLTSLDWNAEVVRGDLRTAVEALKAEPGHGLLAGGVTLPLALAELDLIDEYIVVVHQRIAGHGPTLLGGLSRVVDLELVHRHTFTAGATALTYVPKR